MKAMTKGVLLSTLVTATGWGQDIRVQGITLAQVWKEDTPGFNKATYAPAIQFLNIDATRLGSDKLSLHLYGWGRLDLGEASGFQGAHHDGFLNQGYLEYRFDKANGELKAGRITVNQGTGFEQVDGISARTDLRGGFILSGFAGMPVLFSPLAAVDSSAYRHQRDQILGTRLAWRSTKGLEVGLSYLQDGSSTTKEPSNLQAERAYTRRQVALDVMAAPIAAFDLRGRTVFDLADRQIPAGQAQPSRVAEHDYAATYRLSGTWVFAGSYAERNLFAYYAGTNMPTLFRQDEQGLLRAVGGSATLNATDAFQVVGDYRRTHREGRTIANPLGGGGDSNRVGGELRWTLQEKTLQLGLGGHVVDISDVKEGGVEPSAPYRVLSHTEVRAWVLRTKGKFSASLDGILQHYRDPKNPYLNGVQNVYEVVASLGYQATTNVKVAGDVSFGSNPATKNEVRGLLRAEYRFGFGKKGGQ